MWTICKECGNKYGSVLDANIKKAVPYIGTCDWCKAEKSVIGAFNYGCYTPPPFNYGSVAGFNTMVRPQRELTLYV